MTQAALPRFVVLEVHNYGGFFGGDTVTLDAAPLATPEEGRTLVIDAKALDNVPDRHKVLPGMVFAFDMDGERIDHARLLAAAVQAELRDALGDPAIAGPLEQPLLLSGRCPGCGRWVLGDLLKGERCDLCG
ncbi:MAG TPA: hypothetical protein VGE07_10075 [Herpetosiphonaceae bacterium]